MVTVQDCLGQGVVESNYWLLWVDPCACLYEQDELKSSPSLHANYLLEAIVTLKAPRKLYLYCESKMSPINALCRPYLILTALKSS